MSFLVKNSKSTSEIVAGIIGTVDVGSIIGNAINFQTDVDRSLQELNKIQTEYAGKIPNFSLTARNLAAKTPEQIINDATTNLNLFLNVSGQLVRNTSLQGSAGYRATASLLGLETKLYNALNQTDLASNIIFSFPETISKIKAVRYWNKTLAYGVPDFKTAMILAKNGIWNYSQFSDLIQTEQALDTKTALNITDIAAQQVGKPDLYTAWIMVKKGIWKQSDWYLLAQKGHGYTKEDADALFQHFYYTFSPMELFRILDYTDVDPNWLDSKLSMIGLTDADKDIVKTYLQNRIARQQTSSLWSLTVYNYSWGLMSDTDLTAFLTSNKYTANESALMLIQAQAQKAKIVFQLMRDAEIYLYRKGVLASPTDLLNGLVALGISTDVANAIARNEAAKQGINWEIP